MKKRVSYNLKSYLVPLASIIVVACIAWLRASRRDDMAYLWIFLGLIVFMVIMMLFFSPVSIHLTDNVISLKSPLRSISIPLSEIVRIRNFVPSPSAKSPFGARDWMGTWGQFKDSRVGKYQAFYGNPDNCYLIELCNGKNYLIGCDDVSDIISSVLKRRPDLNADGKLAIN